MKRTGKSPKSLEPYTQLCVWPGTLLDEDGPEKFVEFIQTHFSGTRVKFAEEVTTLPDKMSDGTIVEDTGGRKDLFFYVHTDDLSKFAIPRLTVGIRWWEDVIQNNSHLIYPQEILDKYKPTW